MFTNISLSASSSSHCIPFNEDKIQLAHPCCTLAAAAPPFLFLFFRRDGLAVFFLFVFFFYLLPTNPDKKEPARKKRHFPSIVNTATMVGACGWRALAADGWRVLGFAWGVMGVLCASLGVVGGGCQQA
jgi:hypothetical protein